jgi:hypothetical protein
MKNNALNIRVVADTHEDIFIDFNIHKTSNFRKIHDFLIEKFNLDDLELSSFYYSNNNWDKGEEITLLNMNFEDETNLKFMDMVILKEVFEEGHVKFLYVNDFLNMNIFYLEILQESYLSTEKPLVVLHELGIYKSKKDTNSEEFNKDSRTDEIAKILKENDEDELNDFEELDEDMY